MEFRILGPLEVVDEGRLVPLPRPKHRALLAVLLLHAGEVVSGDRLLEDLWGGRPPPTAKDALQNYVSQLRNTHGVEAILTRPPGYVLDVGPEQIDLRRFEALVARAHAAADDTDRASILREALALWRGLPLADLIDEPFALVEQPVLLDRRLIAYEDLFDAELALGRHARVVAEIEALVEENPYDERLTAQFMVALYRAGRPADALEAFARARQASDELGLEPGPELRELQRGILNHDPALRPPRQPGAGRARVRKTVTVLLAGVGESVGLGEDLDPERVLLLADRVFGETNAAAARHGGTAERLADGSTMAVFGVPETHEDDALRAVRAAVEARDGLVALNLEPRFGLSTGEVLASDPAAGTALVTGTPVSAARQLEHGAGPGEILLGPRTLHLVRAAVTADALTASDTDGRLPAFRLLGVVAGAPSFERHLDARLVGRHRELAALRDAFDGVVAERRCRVVTVLGDAGIGKTRLAGELCAQVREDATVLRGRCASYGDSTSYLPLREAVEQAGGDIGALLAGAGSTGEEHLRVRRFLEALAADQPVVLVLEDIHWAGPSLLDLVEYLGEHDAEARLLVLCLTRPDLLETRPGWPVSVKLDPLPDDQIVTLVTRLPGDVERSVRIRIAELAEGNPLYAEQLLAYAGDGGALESVPPTVEALLAGRLDRLDPGERSMLQRAAVVGREFSLDEVPTVAAAASDVDVATLVDKGLVLRAARGRFRFQHALIRDVAYASLPKAERAVLHERLADRLETDPARSDELVGFHLEQAFRYASELGPVDGRARRLATDAGNRLGAAGLHAWKRGDTPAAANLLGRATALLPEADSFRLQLLCELGVALRGGGELRQAEAVLAGAVATAVAAGDRRAELRSRLELANVRLLREPGGRAGEVVAAAREAIPVLAAVNDDRSLTRAWRLIAYVEGAMSCRYAASVEAAERALDHCRRSGWSTAACLGDLAAALHYGPTPAAEGVRRCRALVKGADLGGQANVLVQLAMLEAMRGRFDEGRTLVDRSQRLYEDIGQPALAYANCGGVRGQIELLAGEPAAAEQAFRESYAGLESIGDRAYLATRAAHVAYAVYAGGRYDEAAQWSRIAEEGGSSDDIPTQFLWRGVRAMLLVRAGKQAEGLALVHEARRLAEATDALNQRANLALDLAEALRLAGRDEEAATAARQALDLFEQKGNVVAAAQAGALIAS